MPSSIINPIGKPFDFIGMTDSEKLAYLKLDQTTPQTITATDTAITASDEVYFGDVTDSSKIKKDTVQGILDLVPASASAHTDLTDMPDSSGTNTDHDTRYVTKVQSGEPSTPAPFIGMLWLDPSETAVDTTDHAELSNLDYAGSGHTGFEPAITAGTSAQFLKGDKSLDSNTYLTAISAIIGAPSSKTMGTVYQAATDGLVVGRAYDLSTGTDIAAYTDASNPPTTLITAGGAPTAYNAHVAFFVRKNDYYKIVKSAGGSGGSTMYFSAMGT